MTVLYQIFALMRCYIKGCTVFPFGPHSAVCKVSCNRGCEFDSGSVPYFGGD